MAKRKVDTKKVSSGKKRGRKRKEPQVVAEEAAAYGIKPPEELPPTERYISPNDAGRILNVTGEAVKQWIYHRRLPATKLSNGYWKIKVSDLEDFIKARQDVGTKRVLIVDNNNANLGQIVGEIENIGHHPVAAHNVTDALLKASDLNPALFIVNVSMDGGDSWKLLHKIRNTRNIKNIPILIISEHELSETEVDQSLELGAQGFLRRPIKAITVAEEAQKILGRIL